MTAPNQNLGGPMAPTEAQPVSGTAPGVAPTLPTVVSVQGVAGGTPLPVSATIPGTVDVSDRVGRQLGIVSVTGQPIGTDVTDKPARQLGIVSITGQPIGISAAALPLPTGAATEATLATRLADATFTGRINTQGQKAMAASTPVVLASDQSYDRPLIARATVACVVGLATTTILAAPGAGLRYRIFGISLHIDNNATGVVDVSVLDGNLGPALAQGFGFSGATRNFAQPIPISGIEGTVNTLLQLAVSSSVATGNGYALVYYLIK